MAQVEADPVVITETGELFLYEHDSSRKSRALAATDANAFLEAFFVIGEYQHSRYLREPVVRRLVLQRAVEAAGSSKAKYFWDLAIPCLE